MCLCPTIQRSTVLPWIKPMVLFCLSHLFWHLPLVNINIAVWNYVLPRLLLHCYFDAFSSSINPPFIITGRFFPKPLILALPIVFILRSSVCTSPGNVFTLLGFSYYFNVDGSQVNLSPSCSRTCSQWPKQHPLDYVPAKSISRKPNSSSQSSYLFLSFFMYVLCFTIFWVKLEILNTFLSSIVTSLPIRPAFSFSASFTFYLPCHHSVYSCG